MAIPPASRQSRRSPDRPDPSRPSGALPDGADEARLDPHEQARIDDAVVRVRRGGGGGPFIVAALVAVAFLVGLVRPWDWLAGGDAAGVPAGGRVADGAGGAGSPDDPGTGGGGGPLRDDGPGGSSRGATSGAGPDGGTSGAGPDGATPKAGIEAAPAPYQSPTCGYPTSWRTAAISFWAGARARVWTAAEAVTATGPADPSIPAHPIASDRVEAIGWCAPISGRERPPLAAVGTLFRVRDGLAVEVPVVRLEPGAPDALGELWVPRAQTVGRRQPWAPGHYVVRLATPSGSYVQYLGLEVGVVGFPGVRPVPSESRSPETAPSER